MPVGSLQVLYADISRLTGKCSVLEIMDLEKFLQTEPLAASLIRGKGITITTIQFCHLRAHFIRRRVT